MLTINFSYKYKKMPEGVHLKTMHTYIRAIMLIDANDITVQQAYNDTIDENGIVRYKLPKTGKLVRIDFWTDCFPAPVKWSTYRKYNEESYQVFGDNLGQEVQIFIEKL